MITEMASLYCYCIFHCWGLDYAHGLPASVGGFIHCLIIIDYHSTWLEAVPTRGLFSATTTQLFHLHICMLRPACGSHHGRQHRFPWCLS